MLAPDTLKNKTILVTGGGSGLGLAMATRFAELGANIAICGRTKEKLQNAKKLLEEKGARVSVNTVDVREYDQVGNWIKSLAGEFDSIDALVNNAAGNFFCTSEDLTPNGFKSVVDIVLTGTFNCSQQFGKHLIDSKNHGSILNIVTTYTETGSAFVLPSACAKAGVQAMTTSLAYEWAPYGIRVNSIAPGPFPTEGAWARLVPDPDFEKKFMKRHPMGRFGNPEELGNLAGFLLSDIASYISGECVTIDGAQRLEGGQFNFVARMMPREKLKAMFGKMREKTK